MSPSTYNIQRNSLWTLTGLGALAIAFWFAQNRAGWHGGQVALPKLLWLLTAIWAWYCQPVLCLMSNTAPSYVKKTYAGLLLLMAVRAVVEGVMLYVTFNWNPAYGMAFNLLAMLWLVRAYVSVVRLDRRFAGHAWVLAMMFVVESGFAWYMRVHFNTAGHDGVYFVPNTQEHHTVLMVTWVAVVGVWLWQFWVMRRGLWSN